VHLIATRACGVSIADALDAPDGAYLHATASRPPSLHGLLQRAHARMARDAAWRARGIPLPLVTDLGTFSMLARGCEGLVGPLVTRSLRCLLPFAPQLFAPKSFARSLDEDPLSAVDRLVDALAIPRKVAA
jgi:hypothetical protein